MFRSLMFNGCVVAHFQSRGLLFRSLVFSGCVVAQFQSRGWCSEVWCSVVVL